MPMYITKKYSVTKDHFFKIYDVNKQRTIGSLLILFVFLMISIFLPAPSNYLNAIALEFSLHSVDSLYDYTLPLVAAFIIFFTFNEDYKNNTYELLKFYNSSSFNYIMFYRWLFYVSHFSLGSFVTGLIYYRFASFFDLTGLLLSLRFIPNILFLCSLILFVIVLTKNSYIGLFIMLSYFAADLISSARMFIFLSLGANSNNFYYSTSPQYYLINRLVLVLLSFFLFYLSCRISVSRR